MVSINGKGNVNNLFANQNLVPKDAKEQKVVKENVPVINFEQKPVEADALKGLAVQGEATVSKTLHKEDIDKCNEYAKAFFPDKADKIARYFTPLNVASTTKTTKEAAKTIGDTITKSHMETMMPGILEALDKLA